MSEESSSPGLSPRAEVFLASLAWLAAELAIVRWAGAEIPRLAFFKNLVLIAALLGGGLGMAAGSRLPGLKRLLLPLLALVSLSLPLLGRWELLQSLRFGSRDEFAWNLSGAASAVHAAAFLGFFLLVYAVALLLFVALGARVGQALARCPALPGYLANLLGSLAGVLLFALLSLLGLPPAAWLLALALPLALALEPPRRAWRPALAVGGLALAVHLLSEAAEWSPYNRVAVARFELRGPGDWGYNLAVNRAYYMTMIDLARPAEGFSRIELARRHYNLPYRFLAPESVLVLGAGGGNDVAAALRAGVPRVTAVEIDPVIVAAGRRHHPEQPYAQPGTRVVVDDARSFLRKTRESYDLIVLGLLDSHTALAGLPGVRLDNYVYTVEAMQAARSRLSPRGILVLSFAVPRERAWIAVKLRAMLEEAFGAPPLAFDLDYDASIAFLAGPGLDTRRARDAAREFADLEVGAARFALLAGGERVAVPRDDWPHLYLRERRIPAAQLLLLVLLLAFSIGAQRLFLPVAGHVDRRAALLGAGFLLLETRGIADLGILFGGTWWTVTATIAAILVMALLSTLYVARFPGAGGRGAWAGLALTLLLGYLVRPGDLLGLAPAAGQTLGALLVAAPVFFSGIVFARVLRRSAHPAAFLGSNLLGAVLGGFLEYLSLIGGVRSLTLVALALYALAWRFDSASGQDKIAIGLHG